MKKWQKIVIGGAAAVLAAVVIFAIHKAGLACANTNKRVGMKIVEANGCVEFWLNRYQSLLGAGATLLAAGLAWFAIQPQLKLARKQNDVAIWQSAGELSSLMALDVMRFITLASKLSVLLELVEDLASGHDDQTARTFRTLLDIAVEELTEVQKATSPWSRETTEVRNELIQKLMADRTFCSSAYAAFHTNRASASQMPRPEQYISEANERATNNLELRARFIKIAGAENGEIEMLRDRLREIVLRSDHHSAASMKSGMSAGAAGRSTSRGW